MRGTCGPDSHGKSSSRQIWWCASIVGTDFIASLKLLLGGAGTDRGGSENLRGDLVGLDPGRNPAVHRNQQQHILHLRRCASVRKRALGMDTELGRPAAGSRDGEHDKA